MLARVDVPDHVYEAAYRRLRARYGEGMDPWWKTVPTVIAELGERWELMMDSLVGRGNTSLLVRCRRSGGSVAILKLGPEAEIAAAEATALRRWQDSRWVPALWAHDSDAGALLLEAIPTADPLTDGATPIKLMDIGELVRGLHDAGGEASLGHGVVDLRTRVDFIFDYWISRYQQHAKVTDVVPIRRLRAGWDLAQELCASTERAVLLHGDLHPANVLNGGTARGLVAIDPRPCIGESAFDLVDWVFWNAEAAEWEAQSSDLAAATSVPHERLWEWCSAFAAMLAANRAQRGWNTNQIQALLDLAA